MPAVWILNHYAIPPGRPGGTRSYDLARQLVGMGWDSTIIASSFGHQSHREEHLLKGETYKEEVFDGVKFWWVRTTPYQSNGIRRVLSMISYYYRSIKLAKRLQRPDAIIGSSVHPLAALAAYKIARRFKCSFLFEVRDLWPQTLIDLGRLPESHPAVAFLRKLELFLYKRAGKIIVLLPEAREYLKPLGVPEDKIVFLPNGVDLDCYAITGTSLPDSAQKAISTLEGKCLVAYTGAHGIANGLDTLIDAAIALKEIDPEGKLHIMLVGDGPEKPKLQRKAREHDLTNVTFLDPIPKEFIPSFLRQMQIAVDFIVPSPLYRFGISHNKSFDYMAAALPIVMTGEARGNPVQLSEGGIVLDKGSGQELAQTLLRLSGDKSLKESLGRFGRRYVENHHSTKALARTLDGVLREVIPFKPKIRGRIL